MSDTMRACLALLNRATRGRIARRMLEGAEEAYTHAKLAEARRRLRAALDLRPADADALARVAFAAWRAGDEAGARASCEAALARDPKHAFAATVCAHVELPGADYLDVLRQIHAELRPRTYVEVGVSRGDSLELAGPHTRTIAIDPDPALASPAPAHVTLLRSTSDEAFASFDFAGAFSGLPLDLAFIDGMHRSEFALRDFISLERLCAPASTILVHDCYPLNRLTAERERNTQFWSGDVWRMIFALKKHRPDLRISTIATPPTGLAAIRNLDPASHVLSERYDAIVAEMLALDYAVLEADKAAALNRLPNDPRAITAMLAA